MSRYPGAIWRPVGNFGYSRGTHGQLEPVAIVDHIAQGTMAGMDAWFNNPASGASAHFAVSRRGQVHQYVDLGDAAWGNGSMNEPDLSIPWLRYCWENEINPNLKTISIEHEGFTGETWPEAMYTADLALHRWLVGAFGIPVDDNHIIGHCRIDSVNRSRCPGTGWPKARLFQDMQEEEDDMALDENADWVVFNKMIHRFLFTRGGGHFPNMLDVGQLGPELNRAVGHPHPPSGGGLTPEQVKTIIKATKLSP